MGHTGGGPSPIRSYRPLRTGGGGSGHYGDNHGGCQPVNESDPTRISKRLRRTMWSQQPSRIRGVISGDTLTSARLAGSPALSPLRR